MGLTKRIKFIFVVTVLCSIKGCKAIRCYQCNSESDPYDQDLCGVNKYIDTYKYPPTDCKPSDTFCVKITKLSPRASGGEFSSIGVTPNSVDWRENAKLRQVERRCAPRSEGSVTGLCSWGVHESGAYWEECSCSTDACNGSTSLLTTSTIFVTTFGVAYSLSSWT